jgi:hypothetical protein
MGNQAKLKRSRHELRRAERIEMQKLDERTRARPEIQELFAEMAADEGFIARRDADLPGQQRRLLDAGWKKRVATADGLGIWDHRRWRLRLNHSLSRETDGLLWGHVSLSTAAGDLPGWYPLRNANWLVYPGLAGLVVVAPESRHVNISECAHVWTCLEGSPLPDFGQFGTI